MLVTISPEHLSLEPGSTVVLCKQTWQDYQHFLDLRQEKRLPKIYFDAKTQEIKFMSPLPSHGNRVDSLRDLVKALLKFQNQPWHCFDPITLKQFQQAGVEPDSCFYIQNRRAILGKDRIDLAIDPPPDLAIEVDLTSLTQLESYQVLQIPELWIYRAGTLKLFLLQSGVYQDSASSALFPDWDVKALASKYVEMAWKKGSSIALRELEKEVFGASR